MKQKFNKYQMYVIRDGIRAKVDVRKFADPTFNHNQMMEILLGLKAGVDGTVLTDRSPGEKIYESDPDARFASFAKTSRTGQGWVVYKYKNGALSVFGDGRDRFIGVQSIIRHAHSIRPNHQLA